MSPRASLVAAALASAFLAEPEAWSSIALMRRARRALGDEAPWLRRLVGRVLHTHAVAPVAGYERLVAFLEKELAKQGRTARARVRVLARARVAMGAARFPVVPLDATGDVAAWLGLDAGSLAWLADVRGLERTARDEALRHYTYRWVPKATGGVRLLEAPKSRTKALQRRVLEAILASVPLHDAVHGFRRGRSVHTHAGAHAGKEVVVRMDLADFFLSVSAARVRAVFRALGYPDGVSWLLASLCTNVTPEGVLARATLPHGATHGEVAAFRRSLQLARNRHLPQGSPTSPALANLVAWKLDVRLAAYAKAAGATYTRYADDLVFSGGREVARSAGALVAGVAAIAAEEGFRVNTRKTRVMRSSVRQSVTGLVVNARPRPSRAELDELRALLHNCIRHGPASQNRSAHPRFDAWLLGRIAWVGSGDPTRLGRLRAMYGRIVWP